MQYHLYCCTKRGSKEQLAITIEMAIEIPVAIGDDLALIDVVNGQKTLELGG